MAKRRRTPPPPFGATGKARSPVTRPTIVHTSVYLPQATHDALREAAFRERRKIHDIVLEGIGLALRKRGRKNGQLWVAARILRHGS
jgi:hypothetical protein